MTKKLSIVSLLIILSFSLYTFNSSQAAISSHSIGGGGGSGTVTNIATGTGLSGGPITTTGTVSLANTAVTPASYTNTNITVDQQGRITSAANGSSTFPTTSITQTGASTGQAIIWNGTAYLPANAALSDLGVATAGNTLANANFAQVWNWDTLSSGTAMKLASSSMTSGSLLNITESFNDPTSTGSLLVVTSTGANNASIGMTINSAAANSTARGLKINMTGGSGGATALQIASVNANGISSIITGSGSGTSGYFEQDGISGGTALYGYSTGASGANFGLQARVDSTDSDSIAALITQGNGSGSGAAIKSINNGSGLTLQSSATGTGIRNEIRIDNTVTAANNSGGALQFAANRTGTTNTPIAGVAGIITDITAGAYKGALIFQTANNAVPSEVMRLDNNGHIKFGGVTPGVSSCGSSPSVAGVDSVGRITVGTGGIAASCTLTFGAAFATAPACIVDDESTTLLLKSSTSTTALTITVATAFGASDTIVYHCFSY